MAKTIRISDEDYELVRSHQHEDESDAQTVHRLLKNTHAPPASQNVMPTQINIGPEVLQGLAEAMRPIINRAVKDAVESALAR